MRLTWVLVGRPRVRVAGRESARGLWSESPTTFWAAGEDGHLLHFDGRSYLQVRPGDDFADFTGIWGASPTDVWAVSAWGEAFHYDGAAWTQLADLGAISTHVTALWGSAGNNIWAVGEAGGIWRFGSQWTSSTSAFGSNDLLGIFGFSASDVWVVGEGGRVVAGQR